ncbi:lipopolysaccharide biosynthesis protein [Sulfuricella sp. T08]|uniref:GumC family protein n=1 Tax=Sulfuricella sp. T08 TaxID=1632857 RepID=UPI0006179D91|nr:Wzz/FepE/Etk N-terminal domain-containing protein [Sulfuricella sp. T08]GAO34655.1 lipopolysaccharide biosynthesis protein [Sulfuricella sp. T08]
MEEQTTDLKDYLVAFRRRKKQILTATGILAVISVLVALLLPPVYRSSATILIEEQEIPVDMVRSTITSYADQRIQVISQHVMTRANMMQIVEKYNLYPRQRKRETTEEILDRMRKDIKLNMVSADVRDRRSGANTVATIAFTLGYDSETAAGAQKVVNELTTLYLNQNLKTRQQKTSETSTFLSEESARLSEHISEIEAKLAEFKEKNAGRLPELAGLNMQMRDRTDSEVMEVDRQLNVLDERKIYLEGQLSQLKPNSPMTSASGERILDSDERLKSLQAQYVSLSGIYSADHPDVIKMRREIDALKKETGGDGDMQEQAKQLTRMRSDLAMMREKYSDNHPDVVKLKKALAALEESHKKTLATSSDAPKFRKPENPAYISMQTQLESTNSELKTLRTKRADLKAKMASYESRLEQAPQVEREYLDLSRDHENSIKRYQEFKAKLMEAEVAQQMEKDSKGERFSLIDPAQLPEKANSPNRPSILLIGMVLSLGGGFAYAGVLEGMDSSIKSSKVLAGLLNAPLLSVIPFMENSEDRSKKTKLKTSLVIGAIVGIALILLSIHFLWQPLDVLWYMIMRKLDVWLG